MSEMKFLRSKDQVPFQCRLCGKCCRNVENEVMIEPLDAYRLARFLHEKYNGQFRSVEDVYTWCAHLSTLNDVFPIYLLNTTGSEDVCVFLEKGRCTVYEARPRVCRLYPFGAQPGERGRAFAYYQCMDGHAAHFTGAPVKVEDWMYENFTKEDRAFLAEEGTFVPRLGKLLRQLTPRLKESLSYMVLYYRYLNYNMDKPFLEQYRVNMETLCTRLQEELSQQG